MVPKFAAVFFIFSIFIFKFVITNITNFCILIRFLLLITLQITFVNNFIFFFSKLIIFIACSLNSKNFFMQSLPLYTSSLFFMLLNDDIVEIEKPDGKYLPTFVLNKYFGLFLYPSILSIKIVLYEIFCIDYILVSAEGISTL